MAEIIALSAEEITALKRRAFLFGLTHDGFKIWDRTAIKLKDVDALDEPEDLKTALREYHDTYYKWGTDLPEFAALIGVVGYYAVTNLDALMSGLKTAAFAALGIGA